MATEQRRLDGYKVSVNGKPTYRHDNNECLPPDWISNAADGVPVWPYEKFPPVDANEPPTCSKCGEPIPFRDE